MRPTLVEFTNHSGEYDCHSTESVYVAIDKITVIRKDERDYRNASPTIICLGPNHYYVRVKQDLPTVLRMVRQIRND